MPIFRSPLATALGTAPDPDASIYIASAEVTKLAQQIGINKLITYLKAQSLWTTLAGGFLLGNDVQKSGASLIDLKAGTSATLCLLYTSPSPRDKRQSRMPSSA